MADPDVCILFFRQHTEHELSMTLTVIGIIHKMYKKRNVDRLAGRRKA